MGEIKFHKSVNPPELVSSDGVYFVKTDEDHADIYVKSGNRIILAKDEILNEEGFIEDGRLNGSLIIIKQYRCVAELSASLDVISIWNIDSLMNQGVVHVKTDREGLNGYVLIADDDDRFRQLIISPLLLSGGKIDSEGLGDGVSIIERSCSKKGSAWSDWRYVYNTNENIYEALSGKQEVLISGVNIKTVDEQSILGSGNLKITLPVADYLFGQVDLTADQNGVILLPNDSVTSVIAVFFIGICLDNSFYEHDKVSNCIIITNPDIEVEADVDTFKVFYLKLNTPLPALKEVELCADDEGVIELPIERIDKVLLVFAHGIVLSNSAYWWDKEFNQIHITDDTIYYVANEDRFKVLYTV